jgi:hypothetical protein
MLQLQLAPATEASLQSAVNDTGVSPGMFPKATLDQAFGLNTQYSKPHL